ncbi:mannitol-1-phosphate 5-dehydrogenase [Alkalicoccus urumqiensis]|uniref:Mannitol-1-phosphate 5-dehydrogenase n=1 Tax=Alkalicoccus urumqiensis TaxID=1548213 RepID=A0A2P6MLJ8_ALKUR|nr:mannitol-1-phosphate 5-dehydrogenase [Alkalicoccus urumqiensis]PRO67154.1 mannitol-1-phosphate 5-dehydrogenase [Alkalicoccus urumqiensis]
MKAVHFGAGNIGRGFIGQLLVDARCELTFADVNDTLIEQMKQADAYTVHYAEPEHRQFTVSPFSALHSVHDAEALTEALRGSDLITTAVGATVLKHLAPAVAKGLLARPADAPPAAVIACENAVGGTDLLASHIKELVTDAEWEDIQSRAVFANAAVDRIVPVQKLEEPLDVLVEPFYEWTVDASAFSVDPPAVEGIHYVENLDAYIERKLFTVNTGHAAASYIGARRGYETVQQAMQDGDVETAVRQVLAETGRLLREKYGFDAGDHETYIDTTVERFKNPELTDGITRVARQPLKKLGAGERLVSPAVQLLSRGEQVPALARVIAAATFYDHAEDEEAVEMQQRIEAEGRIGMLQNWTGLESGHPLFKAVEEALPSVRQ